MNYKNPFNNNINNNINYNYNKPKNPNTEYDYNIYDDYQTKKNNIPNQELKSPSNSLTDDTNFELVYQEYFSKLKPLNSSSDYISCSSEVLPSNEQTYNQLGIPISLSLSPIINQNYENEIPLIKYGSNNIPRCKNESCEIFLNPFVKFIDSGERWVCNFCNHINDTEDHYFCDVDKNGNRLDIDTKPELCGGSYEFEVNKSYYKKNKKPTRALFMFLIETSLSAINSGFLEASIEGIKYAINNNIFYNGNDVNISIITYDTNVSFYSYGEKFTQPQVLTVTDEPTFLPTSKINLILNIEDKDKILQILDLIQTTFNKNNLLLKNHVKDSEKFFSALNGAYLLGKNLGGKILIFSASNIIGKLPKLNGGIDKNATKEQIAYSCHDNKQIETIGINITNENMSIDLFISAEAPVNLLTLNQLCDFTNGNMYFYKKFNINIHYKSIFNQIRRVLSRPIIWEGLNKIKFSKGYKITEYITPLLIVKNNLFVFPTLDADQNYIFNIGIEKEKEKAPEEVQDKKINNYSSNFKENNFLYIQSSLLYSYGDGKRRIRIHNLCLPITTNKKAIFESMNAEIIANYYIKLTIDKLYKNKALASSVIYTDVQFKSFIDKVIQSLGKWPENLDYLPLYFLGFLKHRLFCTNEIDKNYDIDISNYLRTKFLKLNIKEIISYIIPTIYYLNDIENDKELGEFDEISGSFNLPNNLSCSKSAMTEEGLYLIDNGFLLIIYARKKLSSSIKQKLFGTDDINAIKDYLSEDYIFEEKNEFKEKLMNIINYLREQKSNFQNLIFIIEEIYNEKLVDECLIEDNNCKWVALSYGKFYKKYIEDSLNFSFNY